LLQIYIITKKHRYSNQILLDLEANQNNNGLIFARALSVLV